MGTKVRDVIGIGDAFGDSLSRAIGCTPGRPFVGEFRVISQGGGETRVCKEHLAMRVREEIIRTGVPVVVAHTENMGPCQYQNARNADLPKVA